MQSIVSTSTFKCIKIGTFFLFLTCRSGEMFEVSVSIVAFLSWSEPPPQYRPRNAASESEGPCE